MLAHGLAARAKAGLPPLTVLSCDNLSENGRRLQRAVTDYAHAAAIAAPGADRFPNSMVDRITPATSAAIRAEIQAATGRTEPAPVLTEAFSDWVIEDDFAGPRPDWHRVGAILARDVAPYEARKLRCLNAAHSALAYGGLLRGHSYVHEALADPVLRALVDRLWQDAAASLPKGLRATLPGYLDALRARFSVPEMQHRLDQIAMDGSRKLPQRIAPILDVVPVAPGAVGVLAAWIAYLRRSDPATLARADPAAAGLVRESTGRDALIDAALAMTCPDRDAAAPKLAVTETLPDWMETDRHTGEACADRSGPPPR
jgi:fructuronate reductase